ncbi:MAG: virulence associated protein, partial [Myxococcaceae bacterium]|nr:virulence associated protein [Myxococcaceae bacterium]
MRALLWGCFAAILISACECQPGAGLALTVDLKDSAATCVIAGVLSETTGAEFRSDQAVRRGTKNSLIFGIDRTGGLKGRVVPFARGYYVSDCASAGSSAYDESAVGSAVDLDKPGVQRVTLALVGTRTGDGGLDGGADGGEADGGDPDAGGPDAGDGGLDGGGDAGCVPAAAENCLDGTDNTCDGLSDCADPGCNALPCAGGGTCGAQPDGGPSCLQPAETLCGDLNDNDGDGTTDCADPDCAAKSCTDQNACTLVDLCSPFAVPDGGGYCDGGASISCTNLLPDCRASSGVCVPATGACSFAPLDGGESCDDGVGCTHSDRCNGAANCAGTLYLCAASQCVDAGTCLGDGGCAFVFAAPTTACEDLTSCTHSDLCDGLGVCSGTGYSCAAPPACFSGTACLGDGGCSWTFDGVGVGCPGGSCGPDAGCVPFANGFAYPPSNFNPAGIPDASIAPATTFAGCTVEFNSTTNTFTDGGWCNQTKPIPVVIVQDGGISTTVLAMASFSLGSTSTLILSG